MSLYRSSVCHVVQECLGSIGCWRRSPGLPRRMPVLLACLYLLAAFAQPGDFDFEGVTAEQLSLADGHQLGHKLHHVEFDQSFAVLAEQMAMWLAGYAIIARDTVT